MKYTVSYCSERGKNKQACEDSALIGSLVVNEEAGTAEVTAPSWVCLCDGVGGNAGGQEASLFVTRELSNCSAPESAAGVKDLFIEINRRLLEQAEKTADHQRMATTMTAVFLSDKALYLAHVGNTRLYAMNGKSARQLTVDHTVYQWFVDHHLRIFANERNRDAIYGGMGGGNVKALKPLVVQELSEDLRFQTMLLTSDGVHEFLSETEIEEILNRDVSGADKAKMLCSAALEHGSEDDRSVLIICAESVPLMTNR